MPAVLVLREYGRKEALEVGVKSMLLKQPQS